MAKKGKKEKGGGDAAKKVPIPVPRLLEKYRSEIIDKMVEQFSYKNRMAVPRLVKVVVNSGIKQGDDRAKRLAAVKADIEKITGQRAVATRARRSVSGFRLRAGEEIGCKVTLRESRMFEFLDRLIAVAVPRVRDFRGLNPSGFDQRGNYSFGFVEQIPFPEVDLDNVEHYFGMDITVVTTAETSEEGRALLQHLGFPFRKN